MTSHDDTVPVPTSAETGKARPPEAADPPPAADDPPPAAAAATPAGAGSAPPAAPGTPTARRRWISFLSAVAIVLGCVLVPITATAWWVRGTVSNTDRYVAIVGPLASDPTVQDAIEEQLTDRIMTQLSQLDVIGSLTDGLVQQGVPAPLARSLSLLQSPLQDRTEALVRRVVNRVVTSDAFASVWTDANRVAHAQLIRLLEGDTSVVTQQDDGQLVVDLSALSTTVRTALENAGVPGASLLPTIEGTVVIGDGARLAQAQTAYTLIHAAAWVLLVLTFVLLVGGVLLARRRWRATLLALGGVLVAALITLIGLRVGGDWAVSGIQAINRGAASTIIDAVTDRLRSVLRIIGWVALVGIVGTIVTGGGPRATGLRRSVADTATRAWQAAVAWQHTTLLAGAVALVAVVLLLAADLPVAVAVVLVAVVVVAGILAWRSARTADLPAGPPA